MGKKKKCGIGGLVSSVSDGMTGAMGSAWGSGSGKKRKGKKRRGSSSGSKKSKKGLFG